MKKENCEICNKHELSYRFCEKHFNEIKRDTQKEVIDWMKKQGYGNMNHSGFNIICNDAEREFLTNRG